MALGFVAGLADPAGAAVGKSKPLNAETAKSKKTEPRKDFGEIPKGPLQIVVSIANQHVTLYSNGVRVAQGPVSTGVPGRPTPMGVFSLIQKDRFHHSNLYSNAPMPFMQRITWSGVALHEGPLPGYPASHGCIRMTHDFASRLWLVTRLGARVIVARQDVMPVDIAHSHLFAPKVKPVDPPVAGEEPGKRAAIAPSLRIAEVITTRTDAGRRIETPASAEAPPAETAPAETATPVETTEAAPEPLRGTIATDSALDVETTAAGPTPKAVEAPVDPTKPVEPVEPAAVRPSQPEAAPAATAPGTQAPEVADPAKIAPPRTKAAEQPAKHTGQVAVFVSRKEKKVFVRQGMEPLFDMPVEIANPDQPLGTHVFTAMELTERGTAMRWNVMTMPAELPRAVERTSKTGKKRELEPARPVLEAKPAATPAQALDRIQIPQEAIDRISELLVPGSSLVISDQGLGGETGRYTDFIVLAR